MEKIIINGENAIMGRLASYVAKQALLGKNIVIVNANKVIISGNKSDIISKRLNLLKKGGSSQKGPIIPRSSEKILKIVIRGMLPHKYERGKEALKKIRCYNNVPEEYKESKKISSNREKIGKFVELNEVVKLMK